MPRLLILFIALVLPFQFAWSAASAYCQHEPVGQQGTHFGHHVHVHKSETKSASSGKLGIDSDCATCLDAGAPSIVAGAVIHDFSTAATTALAATISPPFASAFARAPDRPQWLRLV